MNKFVNFGKRSVELPAGCRDLIDVLQQAKRYPASTFATAETKLTRICRSESGSSCVGFSSMDFLKSFLPSSPAWIFLAGSFLPAQTCF